MDLTKHTGRLREAQEVLSALAAERDVPTAQQLALVVVRDWVRTRLDLLIQQQQAAFRREEQQLLSPNEQQCKNALQSLDEFLRDARGRGAEAWEEVKGRILELRRQFPEFEDDSLARAEFHNGHCAKDRSWTVAIPQQGHRYYIIAMGPPDRNPINSSRGR